MLESLFANRIILAVNVVNEKADGGADISVEKISVQQLPEYTNSEYATLIIPQSDEDGVFFGTLIIMFPTKMRPDTALKLAAEYLGGNGYSPTDLN